MMKIHDLHPLVRPRERAKKNGVDSLSDQDLLCLILRHGTKKTSVYDMAQAVLNACGGIENFSKLDLKQLMQIDGINEIKAQQLLVIHELARRISKPTKGETFVVDSCDKVIQWMNLEIGYRDQEILLMICLDYQNQFIDAHHVFKGTLNQSMVHPRDILKKAIVTSSSKIILVHNHPSGVVTPSAEDMIMTREMADVLALCAIELLDHIIVGKGNYCSLRQRNPELFSNNM